MNHISPGRAEAILQAARGKRIAVLGDFMLDRHLKGQVRRISPEAPVPVVEIESEVDGPGRRGQRGAEPGTAGRASRWPSGCAATTRRAKCCSGISRSWGRSRAALICCTDRKTTEKMRIIAQDQHVVRADRETVADISTDEEDQLLNALEAAMPDAGRADPAGLQQGRADGPDHRLGAADRGGAHACAWRWIPSSTIFSATRRRTCSSRTCASWNGRWECSIDSDEQLLEAGRTLFERIQPGPVSGDARREGHDAVPGPRPRWSTFRRGR